MLRDAAISLSLANLCFVKVWGKALSGAGAYFTEFKIAYGAIILDVLLLATIFFAGITLVRRLRKPAAWQVAKWTFLAALLTALNGIALLVYTLSGANFATSLGRSSAWVLGIVATSGLVVGTIILREKVLRFAPRALLLLLPFVVITFSQALFKLVQNVGVVHAAAEHAPVANVPHKNPASRVLWIVFDEMDQRLTFNQRPANIELPALDNLRSQSFYATNAYPPAPLTYMSMPALITGRLVAKVTPLRADELMVKFDGESEGVAWSSQPNIFSKARAAGYTTGLAGWCHPYCEVIGGNLSKCEEVKEKTNDDISLGASMFSQAEGLISTIPLVQPAAIPIVQRVGFVNEIVTRTERRKYTVRYKRVLESSLKAAVDPDLDLVFVHSPVPHPPGIYDSAKNDFSLESHNSYADNLELVDRTVGELRKALEKSGLWDQTTVIITADHWWRSEMWSRGPFWTPNDAKVAGDMMDHRIPFLVKLAGQHEQRTYPTGFNTVLTHNLVLALMNGEIQNSTQLANWLDRNRTIADSPYNRDELLP
jgi:hypothetical protein